LFALPKVSNATRSISFSFPSEATVSQREGKGTGLASFPFPSVATHFPEGCYARKWEGLSR